MPLIKKIEAVAGAKAMSEVTKDSEFTITETHDVTRKVSIAQLESLITNIDWQIVELQKSRAAALEQIASIQSVAASKVSP